MGFAETCWAETVLATASQKPSHFLMYLPPDRALAFRHMAHNHCNTYYPKKGYGVKHLTNQLAPSNLKCLTFSGTICR
jgi:hypothetical protein